MLAGGAGSRGEPAAELAQIFPATPFGSRRFGKRASGVWVRSAPLREQENQHGRSLLAEDGGAIDFGCATGGEGGAEDAGRDQGEGGGGEQARVPGVDTVG